MLEPTECGQSTGNCKLNSCVICRCPQNFSRGCSVQHVIYYVTKRFVKVTSISWWDSAIVLPVNILVLRNAKISSCLDLPWKGGDTGLSIQLARAWINPVLTTSMTYKMMFKEMILLLNGIAIEDMGLLTLLFWTCTLWTRTILQPDIYMLWPFRPAIHLPGPSKPVVAVRFCPIIFSLETDVPEEETSSCGELIQILIRVDTICLVLSERDEKMCK